MTSPTLTISQGRVARAPGTLGPTDPGVTAIPGGQVTVGFDDIGTGATATPPFDLLWDNQASGASVQQFQGSTGIIGDAMKSGSVSIPNITDFPVNVDITNPSFQSVSDLSIELSPDSPGLERAERGADPTGRERPPLADPVQQSDEQYGCDDRRSGDHRCEHGEHDQRHRAGYGL